MSKQPLAINIIFSLLQIKEPPCLWLYRTARNGRNLKSQPCGFNVRHSWAKAWVLDHPHSLLFVSAFAFVSQVLNHEDSIWPNPRRAQHLRVVPRSVLRKQGQDGSLKVAIQWSWEDRQLLVPTGVRTVKTSYERWVGMKNQTKGGISACDVASIWDRGSERYEANRT